YPSKLNALYHEFAEIGADKKLGYANPGDLADRYPQFFWSKVERHIGEALRYLELTMEGKQWTAMLYSHIFAIEHGRRRAGRPPARRAAARPAGAPGARALRPGAGGGRRGGGRPPSAADSARAAGRSRPACAPRSPAAPPAGRAPTRPPPASPALRGAARGAA